MDDHTFKRNIFLLMIFELLKSTQFFGAIAVAFYLDHAHVDYTRIFLLEGFFVASVFLLEVPTGVIADKFGRKVSLLLGTLFSGAGFVLFGLVNNYGVFFIANFLCAVGMTLFSGADNALLYDTLLAAGKTDQGRHYQARYSAMSSMGMMIGPLAGSLFAGSTILAYPASLPVIFIASGVMFFLAGFAALTLTEPPRHEKVENPVLEGIKGFLTLFKHKKLRGYAVNATLISAVTFFIFWFYQSLTRVANLPVWINGFVCAGFNGFGMILLWNAARLEKLAGLNRLLILTAVLPGVLFLVLGGLTTTAAVTIPVIFLIAGLKMLRGPLLTDLMNSQIESRNRATVLSGVSMMERAFIGILYPVVGFIADKSLPSVFFLLGGAALLITIVTRIPEGDH